MQARIYVAEETRGSLPLKISWEICYVDIT
jgi:hypothetical protein